MRSTFKVLFYVNASKEKNGIVPIMGRVTINGSVAQFSCKRTIAKELWDVKGNRAKGKSKEAREINLALDNIKAQIIKHYQRLSDREAYVTAEMVRNAYQGIGTEYETLLGAFDKDNATFKKRVGRDRVMATYMSRVRARNHVAAFIKANYKRNDMSMTELTPDFIKEFAVFLATDRGLQNGSIWANCMWLKGVVMRAHYNGLMPRNPFAQFHISPNVKEREFLTEDELKAVMTHEFTDSKLAYIRDLFVFASFTALSFVDIKELTTDDIVEVNGEKWILSKRLQEQKAEVEQELKQVKLEIRTDKLKSVATDAATALASGVSSLFGSGKMKSLERKNEDLRDEIAIRDETIEQLQSNIKQMEVEHQKQIQEVKQSYEAEHRKQSEYIDKILRYFPYVEKLMPMIKYLSEKMGFNDNLIKALCTFKEIPVKGKLYSTMFNQSFSADGTVCSLKEDKEGRFDLKIDGVSHHSWFRRKKDEFMEALGLPTSRRQNRWLKL